MARFFRTPAAAPLLTALLLSVVGTGCQMVGTAFWIVSPNDSKAEYDGLKGKRVAVVCRSATTLQYESADAAGEIAQQVAALLKQNVSRIDVVSQKDVDDWLDNNGMKSYAALGKALKASRVVVIDVERFRLYQGPTLYQGQVELTMTVYDVATGDKRELKPLDTTYPRDGIPVDVPERQFRGKFVGVLSSQIARRFYAYDSRTIDDGYYGAE